MRRSHHLWIAALTLGATLLTGALGQGTKGGADSSKAGAAGAPKTAGDSEKSTVDATFWGALVYASADASAGEPKKPLPGDLSIKLGKAFKDLKRFELLGQHTQGVVFRDYVNWIVPSDEINLELESKGPAKGGGMNVLLKLWQKKKVLVKTDATLKPGSPLFIAGPEWREGRLIFVLELRE